MKAFFISIILLLAILILHGCGPVYFSGDDVTFSEIDAAIKEDRLEETLGSPDAELQTDQYQIKAYEIHRGTHFFFVPGTPIPIPYDSDDWYLTLAFKSDGTYLGRKSWGETAADSPEDAVEMHIMWLAEEEAQAEAKRLADQKARAKELARLGPICEIPFVEAEQLDEGKAISDRFLTCSKGKYLSLWNRMMWGCLVAKLQSCWSSELDGASI